MSWVVAGAVGVSILSSGMQQADENASMEQKADAFGVRRAGIEAAKEQTLENIVGQSAQLQEDAALLGADIEKTEAQARAQAKVNAAASGTAGASVDITIAQADVNAANAKNKLNKQTTQSEEQLKLNFVNSIINAETQIGTLDTSTTDGTTRTLLAGASTFLSFQ